MTGKTTAPDGCCATEFTAGCFEALPCVLSRVGRLFAERAAQTPLSRILASDWLEFSRAGSIRFHLARAEDREYGVLYLPHACGRDVLFQFRGLLSRRGTARRAGLPVCRTHREPRDGRIAAGALGEILCEGLTEAPRVEVLSIQDARLRLAWPDPLYRLVLPFSDRISIRIH